MSIATDVSRIKGNITAALAAIANKGVTVPDGSTSDALASLIASIEAGGGGAGSGAGNIATGSFTNSAPYGIFSIDIMTVDEWKTNYGDFPTTLYAAFFDENPDEITSGYAPIYCASCIVDGSAKKCYATVYSSDNISYSAKTDQIAQANMNNKNIQILGLSSAYYFKPGRTYRWVIIW